MKLGAVGKLLGAALICLQTQAISIKPGDAIRSGPENSASEIYAIVNPFVAPSTLVYKAEVPKTGLVALEEGSLAASYQTTFTDKPNDPSAATVKYISGPTVLPLAYLLVKGGNEDPSWYLFSLSTWNGKETLDLTGFWPGKGAISHISIYGGAVGVPDVGASALLMLLGLGSLAVFGRRSA
ncbi:MAG TPA: hypothetical protein VF773_06000 [Verrucomicrobiae bacterium]